MKYIIQRDTLRVTENFRNKNKILNAVWRYEVITVRPENARKIRMTQYWVQESINLIHKNVITGGNKVRKQN